MNKEQAFILTINGGSSSVKFALYRVGKIPTRLLYGKIDRIGLEDTTFTFTKEKVVHQDRLETGKSDYHSSLIFLMDWLEKQVDFSLITGVGHRVVFGMKHKEPELITQKLLDELHRIIQYDSDHLPAEIELIEVFRQRYPNLSQVACFDTAFHQTMPRVAKLLPIPRRFDKIGYNDTDFMVCHIPI
jgi:acetate kinase